MATTGIGVSAQVTLDATSVSLSLAGTSTHQIVPQVKDAAGTVHSGTAFTLTAAGAASAGVTQYTGTITGGAADAFKGKTFVVAGFGTAANNGTFICTASTATTLDLANAAGEAETHAGTATVEGGKAFKFVTRNAEYATVDATGVITAVAVGRCTIEVSYPTFDNTLGAANDGTYAEKVYKEIEVLVTA